MRMAATWPSSTRPTWPAPPPRRTPTWPSSASAVDDGGAGRAAPLHRGLDGGAAAGRAGDPARFRDRRPRRQRPGRRRLPARRDPRPAAGRDTAVPAPDQHGRAAHRRIRRLADRRLRRRPGARPAGPREQPGGQGQRRPVPLSPVPARPADGGASPPAAGRGAGAGGRAARWHAARGEAVEAVRCSAEAGDWDFASRALAEVGIAAALGGRAAELEEVHRPVPGRTPRGRPGRGGRARRGPAVPRRPGVRRRLPGPRAADDRTTARPASGRWSSCGWRRCG